MQLLARKSKTKIYRAAAKRRVLNRTMYQPILLLVAMAIVSCMADCGDNLSASEFHQVYCESDIVFRGTATGGHSATSMDEDQNWIVTTSASFNAEEVYKGSPSNPQHINIYRVWTQGSPCGSTAFPFSDDGIFIFANNNGNGYIMEACMRAFAWGCIPQSIKDSLPLSCN
ncbi:hypothetical protein RRG08_017254 [Elysia crispata]|uniref:Uncharacterized protein n=1 Tax=Elysia crispata TaxID=231223 RepID=A0AAE0Y1E6_9GAST|nr:hypothetical protein RRG08_017254 [Elysia crispata]